MEPYQDDLEFSLSALESGGLLLYPTDTIWGLGCDPEDGQALERLFELKGRPADKTVLLLAGSISQLAACVEKVPADLESVLGQSDRPTTVIFPGARGPAGKVAAKDGTIGIRISHDPFSRDLALAFGKPLVSTSANYSGEAFGGRFADVAPGIVQGVDHAVLWRRSSLPGGKPSRILRYHAPGKWTVIRE